MRLIRYIIWSLLAPGSRREPCGRPSGVPTYSVGTEAGKYVLLTVTDARGVAVTVELDPWAAASLGSQLGHLSRHVGHKWVAK